MRAPTSRLVEDAKERRAGGPSTPMLLAVTGASNVTGDVWPVEDVTDREEIQANAFAAALLMPERLVLEAVSRLLTADHYTPETLTVLLAKEFEVSEAAMGYRLINLGITT